MSSTTIKDASLTAIDFESTGERHGWGAVPVQVGMASLEQLNILPNTFFRSYVQVSGFFSKTSSQCENTSQCETPTLLSLWPTFEQHLRGRYLVAHGRGTEKRFLRAFPLHGLGPWIDTLALTRAMVPGLSSYQLSDLISYFGLTQELEKWLPDFCWHEALSDALASLILLLHLVKKGGVEKHSIDVLVS